MTTGAPTAPVGSVGSVGSPTVTVVVPAYARPERLARCLAALAAHDRPDGDVEVVVVDDGSPAPGDRAIEAAVADATDAAGPRLAVRFHRQANTGPAGARNAGAAHAQGRWLTFTDDDCAPDPGWVAALVAALEAEPDALVGGSTRNALPGNLCAEASQVLLAALADAAAAHPQVAFWPSNNLACSRDRFAEVGGFDTTFPLPAGEDRDLSERWRASVGPLRAAPDAVVRHFHDMGLAGFWRQHTGYGRGAHHLAAARTRRGGSPPTVEPPGFYLGLLRRPFRDAAPGRALALAALVGLSQLGTAVGYAAEARRARPRRGSPGRGTWATRHR